MSKKPEGIPEDIWQRALAVIYEIGESEEHDTEPVARAILAAVEAERETCAAVLDVAANSQKEAWDEYIDSGGKGPATSFESIFRGQAAAIRQRGQE